MKLTIFLLLTTCMMASARTGAQTVTISVKNAPLKEVFRQIQKQTGMNIMVKQSLLEKAGKVTVEVRNVSVSEVLRICMGGQPLSYEIDGNTIIVKQKEKTPNESDGHSGLDPESFPPIDITGKVTDADGNPLAGANVKVKGSSKATTTNTDGVFVLKGVDDNATLEISFVGFETYNVAVNSKSTIVASLKINTSPLDEMQVIAYGTRKVREQTGNVATVKSKDIEKQPVTNPLLALQGRVPGLFITQTNGLPGSGVTVRIQGQNSLANDNDPLYVIDGVPYSSQLLPAISKVLGSSGGRQINGVAAGSGNPLSLINPADIESIEVLKDADATSIYGSRAAAGAILITTKKGKAGQTRVNFNYQNGWGNVSKKLDLMNTDQYLEMRREAYKNDGLPIPDKSTAPNPFNYDLTAWDQNRYTDWQKVLIGGTAKYLDIQGSVSGGTSNTQFLIAPGFHRETTVFPGDLDDEKGSLHFSINNISTDKKFKLQFSGSYLVDNSKLQAQDLTNIALSLSPNAPEIYNADGSLNWQQVNGVSTWTNPLSYMVAKYQAKSENLISNALLSYQLLPGFDIKSSFGYTNLRSNEYLLSPILKFAPENRPTANRRASYGNSAIHSWIVEPQATYTHNIGKSKIEVLIGTTFQQRKSENIQQAGSGFTSDAVMEDIRSAPTVTVSSSLNATYNYNAVFGRLNYNFQDKYIINLAGRKDGSSRFGSNNLFHNFWSVGGAWILSQEKFIQKLRAISFGKIRGSYGTTGNDQIGDYRFMNLYTAISAATPYQTTTGLGSSGLPNPDVQWEETRKLQIGLDLGFSNNRFLLTVNYYNNRSSNQLLSYPLPQITGFQTIDAFNLPANIQNNGWEFDLETRNLQKKNFSWNTSINLTLSKNKLIDFPDFSTSAYANLLVIGEPFTLNKLYHYQGVDPQTGLSIVSDANGNSTSKPDASKDKIVLVNTLPTFYGGIQNSVTYKNFELDFLFQFVKQKGSNYFFGNLPGQFSNQPTTVLNRWQKTGDEKPIQKYSSLVAPPTNFYDAASAATGSDRAFDDASYIRLKNLSLSWHLPKNWLSKAFISNGRLYVQGQNLLTITHYLGLDPENASVSALPPLRVITVGIQVTF